MTITFILVQLLSLAATGIGFLCYRHIINSRQGFLSSLNAESTEIRKVRFGMLLWVYILLSLVMTAVTTTMYLLLPRFF